MTNPGSGGPRGEAADSRLRPLGERLALTLAARARDAKLPRTYLSALVLRELLASPEALDPAAVVEIDTLRPSKPSLVLVHTIGRRLREADELERAVLEDEEAEEREE